MAKKTYFPVKKGKAILYYFTIDNETGEFTAYYAMRIDGDNTLLELAEYMGYDICYVSLGTSPIKHKSVMVPCCTSPEGTRLSNRQQARRAMQFAKGDINDQRIEMANTRCLIPAEKGVWKRCPYSELVNTDGTSNRERKCCDGTGAGDACPFAKFKQASSVVPLSELDVENEAGEREPYEIASPVSPYESTRYEQLSADFLKYVKAQKPKLEKLAELLVKGYAQRDAERVLGKKHSTIWSQNQLLKQYAEEFLRTVAIS